MSRFKIETVLKDGFSLVQLKDMRDGAVLEVMPGCGAMWNGMKVRLEGREEEVIEGYANPDDLAKDLLTTYKGVKLAPFACRIHGATYTLRGKKYTFSKTHSDGAAIHGLVFDKSFEVVSMASDEYAARLELVHHYLGEDSGYPFPFECRIVYELGVQNTVTLKTTITNRHGESIPISDGWHPYFKLGPLVDDWHLQFRSKYRLEHNPDGVPGMKQVEDTRFLHGTKIGAIELDNCFLLTPGDDSLVCELSNPQNGLRVSFYTDGKCPYLQVYIPPSRKSIAIENLGGPSNCFNHGMGLTLLEAGASETYQIRYRIRKGFTPG